MENTIKTISIELLAEKLGGNLWVKGDMKRIYLDEGYNTKKMTTKTYAYQKQDGAYAVKCSIDCTSQNDSWIFSQQEQVENSVSERIAEIVEEFGTEIKNPAIEIQAALDAEEQVQGYYMRWHDVRVAINRFGKLADRKRMQVHTYKGAASKTPAGFISLIDEDFSIALQKEAAETHYEYGNEPVIAGMSEAKRQYDLKQQNLEAERKAAADLAKEKEAEEKAKADAALAEKIEALKASGVTDEIQLWVAGGCVHPAPEAVAKAKVASGLGWNAFTQTLQNAN